MKRVLLVEDRGPILRYFVGVLSEVGFRVHSAGSAVAAWELFLESEGFDWVIADFRLGQCDQIPNGAFLLRMIKERSYKSRTVLMTSWLPERVSVEPVETGIDHWIEKDVDALLNILGATSHG